MKRISLHRIEIDESEEKKIASKLQEYWLREHGEELGRIECAQLVDFLQDEIGPIFYDRGVLEAQRWVRSRNADMDSEFCLLLKEE